MPPVPAPLLSWSGDLPAVILCAVLALGYAAGVRALLRRGLPWPRRRSVAWAAGLAALLAVTGSGVGRDAHLLLWVYSVQVVVLLLVAPVLLAYGRPLTLVGDLRPGRPGGQVLPAPLRLLASPIASPLAVPAVLFPLYFTPLLSISLSSAPVWQAVHLALLGVGFLLGLGLIGEGGRPETSIALGAAVAICFGELLLDALPGIALFFDPNRVAPAAWGGLATVAGLTPMADQQRAAQLLWLVAELADLPFLAVLVRRWVRTDELEARRVDAELDAQLGPGPAAGPAPDQPELLRPWWETDRDRLAGHRLAREPDSGTC